METYGVCLDEAMEGRYPAPFVASLAAQLPQGCRWRVSYDQDMAWTLDRVLTAALVNGVRGLIWGLSDKDRRGPEPEPIGPAEMTGRRRQKAQEMTASRLMAELAKPRREARDG